eukprot:4167949-Karenia_brevis.AAC.1
MKNNAHDEGQFAVAALLKPEHGALVSLQDEMQIPRYLLPILRLKRREQDAVDVSNRRTIS